MNNIESSYTPLSCFAGGIQSGLTPCMGDDAIGMEGTAVIAT